MRSELRGSIRWLLKRRGIEIECDPFSQEGRRKLREEIQLQEIDIRLQELELVESIVEKLDRQLITDSHSWGRWDTYLPIWP